MNIQELSNEGENFIGFREKAGIFPKDSVKFITVKQ